VNRYLLHPEAEAEFIEAVQHYAAISSDLGSRFYDKLEKMFYEAGAHPLRYRLFIRRCAEFCLTISPMRCFTSQDRIARRY
jgi:hypothetical protein